ncbi:CREB-regulated transcription coactivator 1-like isoform X1 [Ornithodoros turicata]|uniref:CREB-regulated transcription coactivator 1-like isoform X1 n=1 Tax=Ornithodoros turicata TaxID=34597 RepID=UPI00313A3445
MTTKNILCVLLLVAVMCISLAQRLPPPPPPPKIDIRIPPPPPPPRTHINIHGGGSPHGPVKIDGTITHDIYNPKNGPSINIWGQGSHNSQSDPRNHGTIGVGIRFPFGGRRRRSATS